MTEIKNANQARINGAEFELDWAASYNLQVTAGAAFYDAKLTANYCGFTDEDGVPVTDCAEPEAPHGTRLPVTPRFKGNLIARYTFDVAGFEAHVQGAAVHVGQRTSDLRLVERDILGDLDAYTVADVSAGFGKDDWSVEVYVNNLFDERAQLQRFTQCGERVCGNRPDDEPAYPVPPEYAGGQVYTLTNQPRTIGVRFSQKF